EFIQEVLPAQHACGSRAAHCSGRLSGRFASAPAHRANGLRSRRAHCAPPRRGPRSRHGPRTAACGLKRQLPNEWAPMNFAASGFFALRTPLLPFDEFLAWSDGLKAPAELSNPAHWEQALAEDRQRQRARL